MNAPATNVLSFRPIDDLEATLIERWQDVCRATHGFLVLLREFDLRQGWKAYGNVDCADWLNWRCGIARVTGQEKVRIARALWGLPQIDEAFARGDLSYSKVRALCRVATQRNETELLGFALDSSAAQVEAYCRRLRNGDAEVSAQDAKRLHESRSLCRQFREDGSGCLTVELPRAELELVLKALEFVGSTLPDDPTRSLFAKGADALLQMARDALTGRGDSGAAPESYQVVVHVDAAALSVGGGESNLPLPTVRRLCCDGSVVPIVDGNDGQALSVGRRQRAVPTALKRALFARDRTCTFPGCHHDTLSRCTSHRALGGRRRDEPRQSVGALHDAPPARTRRWIRHRALAMGAITSCDPMGGRSRRRPQHAAIGSKRSVLHTKSFPIPRNITSVAAPVSPQD